MMKSILQQIAEKSRKQDIVDQAAVSPVSASPSRSDGRRNFLKKAALGGIALGGMMKLSIEDTIAQTTSKVTSVFKPV